MTITCKRIFRSSDGEFRACDGPFVFAVATGAWTCAYCGREIPRLRL